MAAKKKVTKKAPAKKATAKKAPAKKARATKATTKKAAVKKAPTKKKTPAKSSAKKASPAKKASTKKVVTTKATKPAAKKAPKAAAEKVAKPEKTASAEPKKAVTKAAKVSKAKEEVNGAAMDRTPVRLVRPEKPVKLSNFVKKQRRNLLCLRDELMDAMYGVQQEALRNGPEGSEASGSGMHQGDAGSDAYDRDFALNLLSKEQDALQEIEAALLRIDCGVYGLCEMSDKKIPVARLEAIPFARLTVECQTVWEKEGPNRQFRAADAIGYGEEARNGSLVSLDAGD